MNGAGIDRARDLAASDLAVMDEMMRRVLASRAAPINAASRHLLESGGKRVRALLCVLAGRATGLAENDLRVAGCAAEMIHAASLCHDDVLDRGTLRRGQPTVRVLYGDAMSILLGDFFLTRAMRLLAEHGLSEAAVLLADAVVAMAEGEVAQAGQDDESLVGTREYLAVAAGKTGALLSWCATVGGLVSEAYLEMLADFGHRLGRVYQIADDLLDFEPEAESGKTRGQDLLLGGSTMPLLLAFERQPDLRERVRRLRGSRPDVAEIDRLIAEIRDSGAIDKARALAADEAQRAVGALAALPSGPCRDALADLAYFAADRHA